MKKTVVRVFCCVLAMLMALSALVIAPNTGMMASAASAGSGGGSVGATATTGAKTDNDSTVIKIQAAMFQTEGKSDNELVKTLANLDVRQDSAYSDGEYLPAGLAFLVQVNENAMKRKQYKYEMYRTVGSNSVYCDWGDRYIEDYKDKICADADGKYFYDTIKGAVKGVNITGIGGSSQDLGTRLNNAITKNKDKEKFVKGFIVTIKVLNGGKYDESVMSGWLNTGEATMMATALQGINNSPWNVKGETRRVLMSTHMFTDLLQQQGKTKIQDSFAKEGLFLNGKGKFTVHESNSGFAGLFFWMYKVMQSINRSIYPVVDATGTKLTMFGGWGYYPLGKIGIVGVGRTTVEKAEVYRLGSSDVEKDKFGQDGIVAVKNIASEKDENDISAYTINLESDEASLDLVWSKTEASAKCDTPYKDAIFKRVGYRYRILSNDVFNADGTAVVLKDWTEKTGDSLAVAPSEFPEVKGFDIPSYRLIMQVIYQYDLGDNYKAPTAAQNLLTATYSSLKEFTKSGTVPNNLVDDRFAEDKVISQDKSGKVSGFGTLDWRLTPVNVSFPTSFSPFGTGVLAGRTYQTAKAETSLAGEPLNNWSVTQHDSSVWLSRAGVNDVVHLASWAGNGIGITDFLVNQGGFINSVKGRGTQPKMVTNGVAGFVRSMSATLTIGDDIRNYSTWDEKGTPVNRKYVGEGQGTVVQGAVDTQVGTNFARYTPKTLSYKVPKGLEEGIEEYTNDKNQSYAVYTGEELNVNPEVTMQYQDMYGNTGNVVTAGDTMRKIPVIAYLDYNMGVDATKTTITSTAIATDARAKALSAKNGGLPVFLAGGGITATFEGGTIGWKTYVLDVANSSLKSAWGNDGYDPLAIHEQFVNSADSEDPSGTIKDKKKTMSATITGMLNIGATSTNKAQTIQLQTTTPVSIDITNGGTSASTSQTVYNLTIRKGKIVNYGGLPEDIAKKMKLDDTIAQAFETNGGDNKWYNEDSTALCVRVFESTAKLPKFSVAEKLPLDIGPKSNADKNAAWVGSVCSLQTKVEAKTTLVYKKQRSKKTADNKTVYYWSDPITKTKSFSGVSTPDKSTSFIIPNKTILDINQ